MSASANDRASDNRAHDQQLVEGCLRGEDDAWRKLLERHKRLIYAIAVRRGFDADAADEIFQSVAITLAERLHLIKDPTCLPKWLIVTTVRRCRAHSQARARQTDLPNDDKEAEEENAEDWLLREERRLRLNTALSRLKPRDREVVIDLFVRELPYAEVAARHGLAIGSLGSLRARALARLRLELEELER